jgi:hypothetical protein
MNAAIEKAQISAGNASKTETAVLEERRMREQEEL